MSKETSNAAAKQILVAYHFVVALFEVTAIINARAGGANGDMHLPDAEEKPRSR